MGSWRGSAAWSSGRHHRVGRRGSVPGPGLHAVRGREGGGSGRRPPRWSPVPLGCSLRPASDRADPRSGARAPNARPRGARRAVDPTGSTADSAGLGDRRRSQVRARSPGGRRLSGDPGRRRWRLASPGRGRHRSSTMSAASSGRGNSARARLGQNRSRLAVVARFQAGRRSYFPLGPPFEIFQSDRADLDVFLGPMAFGLTGTEVRARRAMEHQVVRSGLPCRIDDESVVGRLPVQKALVVVFERLHRRLALSADRLRPTPPRARGRPSPGPPLGRPPTGGARPTPPGAG